MARVDLRIIIPYIERLHINKDKGVDYETEFFIYIRELFKDVYRNIRLYGDDKCFWRAGIK